MEDFKRKNSSQTTSQNNARRQPKDTILEQENTVYVESDSSGVYTHISSQPDPDLGISNLSDSNELLHSPVVPLLLSPKKEPSSDCLVFRDTSDEYNSPDYCGNFFFYRKADLIHCTDYRFDSQWRCQ